MQTNGINSKNGGERHFFEGPHSRFSELFFTLKVLRDFIRGFRAFHFLGPCATVFGSARYKEGHEYYEQACTVMTGGGPGLMEAANKGAKQVGGRSVGCNIKLPREQKANSYLDKWVIIDYFFVRKVLLSKYSYAFIAMPGGYGTLDEFFEALTLIQTKKSKYFPVVLFGKHFHSELKNHLDHMLKEGTISEEDLKLFIITDSVEEAAEHIRINAVEKYKLKDRITIKPSWLLIENK
jgi:uncharacterized protein (TIGR00730 family)